MILKNKKNNDKIKPHPILRAISTCLFLTMLASSCFLYIEFNKNEDELLKTITLSESTNLNISKLEKIENILQYNKVTHNLNDIFLTIILPEVISPSSQFNQDLIDTFKSMDEAPILLAKIKEKKTQPLSKEQFNELQKDFEAIKNLLSKPLSSNIKKSQLFPVIERTISKQTNSLEILLKNETSFNIINTYRSLLTNVNFLNEISSNTEKAWADYFSEKYGKDMPPVFEILSFKNKG